MKIHHTQNTIASVISTLNLFAIATIMGWVALPSLAKSPNGTEHYVQVNLVSDQAGVAQIQDTNLVNAWGISFSGSSPFWISDNGTGKSTLYAVTNGVVTKQRLTVNIPGEGNPTGQFFNGTPAFHTNFFIFVSEDGTISGWRPALGVNAEILAQRTTAVYKGTALAANASGQVLLAANFAEATIDVYDTNVNLVTQFSDPDAPSGYAPFNVQNIDGVIFVTFAKQDDQKHDDVPGIGHGLIDVLNPQTGQFLRFVTGSDAGGKLKEISSPWGMALAPDSFGKAGGDLLVGNFGSGTIMTFNENGDFQGLLKGHRDGAVVIDGLWALTFGNRGSAGGSTDTLFFTAGPDGENHGLFGFLQPFNGNGKN
jgi:uncharacterized protein (TIGR03118 family)